MMSSGSMWRDAVYRRLSAMNRVVKRFLGADHEQVAPPGTEQFLDAAGVKPTYADDAIHGSWVFVLQYVARGSGGLSDILHLGEELEKQYGLSVSYYVMGGQSVDECRTGIRWTLPTVRDEQVLDRVDFIPEFLCATAWPTAYCVSTMRSKRKLYFVQDYEPWFHRAGMSQHHAQRTYEMGFELFTLGPWLAEHLVATHGCQAEAMPFPATDLAEPGRPLTERKVVAFYVQPDKEHRGTELMIEGARRLSVPLRERGLELVIFGSAENEYLALDFPCTVRGVLDRGALEALFRSARAGVGSSFSNVSLMTFRFLTFGCMTLEVDRAANHRNVPASAAALMRYFDATPEALLTAVLDAVDHPAPEADRKAAALAVAEQHSWQACARSLGKLIKTFPPVTR